MMLGTQGRWMLAVALTVAIGCGQTRREDPDELTDAGAQDAGQDGGEETDAGFDGGIDAGEDAGFDAGVDAGTDAGVDAGTDAGSNDAGPDAGVGSPSAQIAAARATVDGIANVLISGAIVTYVKPKVGIDAAGFFLQGEPSGPALFVAVDPVLLSPQPTQGDRVALVVQAMGSNEQIRQATAISDFVLIDRPGLGNFVQDVTTASDLVSGLESYDNELVRIDGQVASGFVGAGAEFVSAQFSTAGVPSSFDLRLRIPEAIRDVKDLVNGCEISIEEVPLWRFRTTTQPSANRASEVVVRTCPAPKVVLAVSLSATSVAVEFDRAILPSSLLSSGAQFTFNGLSASAATVAGRRVTVTTSTQVGGQAYAVTVASTVSDQLGRGVEVSANSAGFLGYRATAVLRLSEVNPNISGGSDLVELVVVEGGNTLGLKLQQDFSSPTTLATFPDAAVVAGDVILVHLKPSALNGDASGSETSGTSQYPSASFLSNVDSAWDFHGDGTNAITFSSRVILVRAVDGSVQDGVAFHKTGGTPPGGYPANLQELQALGLWFPADCEGARCDSLAASSPIVALVSADWGTTSPNVPGGLRSGFSVRRVAVSTPGRRSDWSIGESSWGVPQ